VLDHVSFADHHPYSSSDIDLLNEKLDSFGSAAKAVITTEKDMARLRNTSLLTKLNLPVFYLPIEVKIENVKVFDKMILEHGKYVGKDK
jgi:tetraacyldisaccharide 4'-kinase